MDFLQEEGLISILKKLDRKLDRILLLTRVSLQLELSMSKEVDDMAAEVAETNTVMASAVVLIEGIAARIAEAGVDATKLAALTAELDTKSQQLAAAVAANTPAAPPA